MCVAPRWRSNCGPSSARPTLWRSSPTRASRFSAASMRCPRRASWPNIPRESPHKVSRLLAGWHAQLAGETIVSGPSTSTSTRRLVSIDMMPRTKQQAILTRNFEATTSTMEDRRTTKVYGSSIGASGVYGRLWCQLHRRDEPSSETLHRSGHRRVFVRTFENAACWHAGPH
jgi:hypothetical protein